MRRGATVSPTSWRASRWVQTVLPIVLFVAAVLALALLRESDPTQGDRYGGDGVRVEADVLRYDAPSQRDGTGVVSVAFPVGSSEMRVDIETEREDFGPTVDVVYDPEHPSRARVADE